MNVPSDSSCTVVTVRGRDGTYPEISPGAFLDVIDADTAVYVGAYLARRAHLDGLWWRLQPGYSPALIARDLATLSHLGKIKRVAIVGHHSVEAVAIISALLGNEPVSMSTSFGELVEAVNRPPIADDLELCVGHQTDSGCHTTNHVTVTRP